MNMINVNKKVDAGFFILKNKGGNLRLFCLPSTVFFLEKKLRKDDLMM